MSRDFDQVSVNSNHLDSETNKQQKGKNFDVSKLSIEKKSVPFVSYEKKNRIGSLQQSKKNSSNRLDVFHQPIIEEDMT